MTQPILKFDGAHRYLSNFYSIAPARIEFEGLKFHCVETAYQAAKTLDLTAREAFTRMTAAESKKAGRKVVLRPGWDTMRLEIMEDFCRQKFTKNETLRQQLLATGDAELVEGNWWGDTFFGVCNGKGENHLGKILMKIRAELRSAQ